MSWGQQKRMILRNIDHLQCLLYTNLLAPPALSSSRFGIEKAWMTTVHSYTADPAHSGPGATKDCGGLGAGE